MKNKLNSLATMFEYKMVDNGERIVFVDDRSRILPGFEVTGNNEVFVYFTVRTTSWDFDGERTDVNDALSLFMAIFLRVFDVSCVLWDIPNMFSRIPTELYGRYITVGQPNRSNYKLDEFGLEQLKVLLFGLRFFEDRFWSFLEWDPEIDPMLEANYGWQDRATQTWAQKVAKATGETLRSHKIQYNFRKNPGWLYYRTIAKNMSIFRSEKLALGLRELIDAASNIRSVQAVSGIAFESKSSRNLVPYVSARIVQDIFARLEPQASEVIVILPIDTHFLTIGTEHLAFLRCDCGKKLFDEERKRVRARRKLEDSIFFPGVNFIWCSNIDDRRFELLIRDLLAVEPGVHWVRKVGETREGDEGRDLICEWATPLAPNELVEEQNPPVAIRKVIIQCKVSIKSVGKSKVQDIYDTVKHHGYDGYFLAVSSQISTPLTRFLEGLRNKSQIWADWWTRSEIEDRLRDRPEILARYSDVVKIDEGR